MLFEQFFPAVARNLVTRSIIFQPGFVLLADINRIGTTGVEFAARRLIGWRRDFTFKLLRLPSVIGVKHGKGWLAALVGTIVVFAKKFWFLLLAIPAAIWGGVKRLAGRGDPAT